ncbi:MAG: hypothetical protein WDM91_15095 [Rhizomicrobium sp.]
MSPEVGTILGLTQQKLASGFGEHGAAFAAGTVGLLGLMLNLSAQEYERGADIRFAENTDLRALFGALAASVQDAGLRARLEAAAAAKDASLRISALNENNYPLRRLLTELQIDAEARGDAEAQRRIWAVLKALAARRFVTFGA